MSARLAACDPCRRSKLACDHAKPVCARCRGRGKSAGCVYRARPFQRLKQRSYAPDISADESIISTGIRHTSTDSPQPLTTPPERNPSLAVSPQRHRYPNPGFLGSSSHEAIFNQFPSNRVGADEWPTPPAGQPIMNASFLHDDDLLTLRGARLLKNIHETSRLSDLDSLVFLWTSTGTTLALAGPFLKACIQSMQALFALASDVDTWSLSLSKKLLKNTSLPFSLTASSTLSDYRDQFCGDSARWETLGLFLGAVSRATNVIPYYAPLYSTESERQHLQKLMTSYSDQCLELSLALDCLNDLQLFFHYENCIVHSFVDGDQSFHTWRKLGDIVSSLFALGYHEKIESGPRTPPFLAELRKVAFARIYSADKNMSLFLGRPCRMNGRFCNFQIPSNNPDGQLADFAPGWVETGDVWAQNEEMNFVSDSKWTGITAILKEEIMELFRSNDRDRKSRKVADIQRRAELFWSHLPPRFRIEHSLNNQGQTPFERDFMVHTRLNYLQIFFCLRLMLVAHVSEPDTTILRVAQEMLSLVVELIVLRDQIANSGTGLVWKVAHYGLPAAGIISLALLSSTVDWDGNDLSRSKVLRNLTVLVVEAQIGGVVPLADPNYALISSAASTIQHVLNVVDDGSKNPPTNHQMGLRVATEEWDPWMNGEFWDFELDFWRNLAEHPSLAGLENDRIA